MKLRKFWAVGGRMLGRPALNPPLFIQHQIYPMRGQIEDQKTSKTAIFKRYQFNFFFEFSDVQFNLS